MLWVLIRIAPTNICCGYSLESPHRDDSIEYPQHMFCQGDSNEYPQHVFMEKCEILSLNYPQMPSLLVPLLLPSISRRLEVTVDCILPSVYFILGIKKSSKSVRVIELLSA